jgi:hypothetical protein
MIPDRCGKVPTRRPGAPKLTQSRKKCRRRTPEGGEASAGSATRTSWFAPHTLKPGPFEAFLPSLL